MSDTPRTDEAVDYASNFHPDCEVVNVEVAIDLEREIAEAKNKIERQGARIKYLEGATNHATGTPLTKALEQLDEMRIDRDEWKAVSEGQLLDLIDKVAQLERELAEARMTIDDGGPVAPNMITQKFVDANIAVQDTVKAQGGLSLRDYFAAAASEEDIQRMRDAHKKPVPGSDDGYFGPDYIYPTRAEGRYLHADAMLAARKEGA